MICWTMCGFCVFSHMCQGLNSHYCHILGDGHQPNSRGLYTHYSIRIPIKGGMTISNIATFDHGTYQKPSCPIRIRISSSPLRTPLSHFGMSPKNDCNDGGSHFAKLQDPTWKFTGSTMWCLGIWNTRETDEISWMDIARWQMKWIRFLLWTIFSSRLRAHTHTHATHHTFSQVATLS